MVMLLGKDTKTDTDADAGRLKTLFVSLPICEPLCCVTRDVCYVAFKSSPLQLCSINKYTTDDTLCRRLSNVHANTYMHGYALISKAERLRSCHFLHSANTCLTQSKLTVLAWKLQMAYVMHEKLAVWL